MKIHILYDIKKGPWGGGNQFLKALRDRWNQDGRYTDSFIDAEVILINSHHIPLFQFLTRKIKKKSTIIVHRIDGPVSLVRGTNLEIDKIIYNFNYLIADGTIFQSEWSKNENYKLGYKPNSFETIIINAPDKNIFFYRKEKNCNFDKIKIIATSWSPNFRKGFDVYQYLDDNLDFTRYEMTFVGNSPIMFKNIRHHQPVTSDNLAKLLRNHHIFLTASRNEPCSNSLIEALHCGLPVVYIRQGSHESIVGNFGEGFTDTRDVLKSIESVSTYIKTYSFNNGLKTIDEVAEEYYKFCEYIVRQSRNGKYSPKKNTRIKCLFLLILMKLSIIKALINGSVHLKL